ncbi:recombinase RecT [Eubacterium maltosivorans]|uniref:recombinase RecT n=1 Tax=Eubacterium maltosivorans TaxID=2041044 RepID=UPI00189CEF44|nr:recombinase RecT [Eubacterium maltosivorans]
MANEVVKKRVDEFKNILNDKAIRAQLKNSLKENAGSFASSMIDLYTGDTSLQACDPRDVAMECLKAASLKLPLVKALGQAYVVPFKNKPTFLIGYKGYIQLAQRTGFYRYINAGPLKEGQMKGIDLLTGAIDVSGEAAEDAQITGYFAYFQLLNGFEKALYMTKEEVIAWADKYAPSFNSSNKSGSTPWYVEFDKMATKTVIRRLLGTYGPMTDELSKAFVMESHEDRVDREVQLNANKKPMDFEDAEVTEVAEMQSGELSEEEKARIIAAELAEEAQQEFSVKKGF